MKPFSRLATSASPRQDLAATTDSAAEPFAMIHELSRTARQLQDCELRGRSVGFGSEPFQLESDEHIAAHVRRLLANRERRKKIFPAELFADPAWDILLNLYVSHLEQRRETITGVIYVSGVPATTGLRWVHKLVEEDLLILRDDPLDMRRKWVMLSPTALAALKAYFSADR